MCASCRKALDNEKNKYITNEIRQQCDQLFEWLYDFDVVHTPTTISSQSSTSSYSSTIYNRAARDDQETLKNFLRSTNYKYEIPVTFSYNGRSSKSRKRKRKQYIMFTIQFCTK
jgi:intein/homing endonuclease